MAINLCSWWVYLFVSMIMDCGNKHILQRTCKSEWVCQDLFENARIRQSSMVIYLKTIWVITLKWVHIKIITFFTSSAILLPFHNAVHNFSVQKEEVNFLLVWLFGSPAMVSRFNFIQRHFTKVSTYPLHLKWCLELYMIKLEMRSGLEL